MGPARRGAAPAGGGPSWTGASQMLRARDPTKAGAPGGRLGDRDRRWRSKTAIGAVPVSKTRSSLRLVTPRPSRPPPARTRVRALNARFAGARPSRKAAPRRLTR